MPKITLIEDLTTGPIPAGSQLLVEYDPASQWYNSSVTIAAEWIRSGGTVLYCTFTQPPDDVRAKFIRLGLNVQEQEGSKNLGIYDLYSATLGKKSKEKDAEDSLKAADWSIRFLHQEMPASTASESDFQSWSKHLVIVDDESTFARFNEEKVWVELELTRIIPSTKLRKITYIAAVMRGIHSEWVYKRLESAMDGVIDFKIDETEGRTRDLIRIRTMRNVHFDREWHEIKIGQNFDVTLEK